MFESALGEDLEPPMSKSATTIWVLSHLVVVLVAIVFVDKAEGVLQGVLVGVIGSGFVGLSLVVYIFVAHRVQERQARVRASGIHDVFEHRSVRIRPEYERRLDSAKKRIDIMGFGLHTLLGDFKDQFHVWERRATVRILLIDPEFPHPDHSFAEQRDVEEGDERGKIAKNVKAFVTKLSVLIRNKNKFHVRLYRAAPSVNYFRIDDEAFWGPYLVSKPSRNMPTLLIDRAGTLFGPLADHFEDLWNNHARDIPADWLKS